MLAVGRALPPHHATQDELVAALRGLWAEKHFNVERLEELHRSVQVNGRHLALPLADYPALDSFACSNDAWIAAATQLGEAALRDALIRAGVEPGEVGHLFFVSVTGIATPSIDARLVNRLRLSSSVKRTPIFGLGCVAGAAGIARASDYLRAFPKEVAVLLSVELCSLTLQREDLSVANIVASGLFGDGAAAVVLGGARWGGGQRREGGAASGVGSPSPPPSPRQGEGDHRAAGGPRIVATRSVFYPDTERVMGWDVVDSGFKVVLSAKVPEVVRAHVREDVDAFLGDHGLARGDLRHFVAHTGGPKVLQAFESALELPPDALLRSWRSLREVGNLSSASVLFVLAELIASGEPAPGDLGLLMAMGPGFCAELVLLQW